MQSNCRAFRWLLVCAGFIALGCKDLPQLDAKRSSTQGKYMDPGNSDLIGDFIHTAHTDDGRILIAYFNQSKSGLEVALEDSSGSRSFARQLVPFAETIGYYNHIAIGPKNEGVILSYNKTSQTLVAVPFAVDSTKLTLDAPQIVDNGTYEGAKHKVGKWSSAAIDPSGVAHIAYYDETAKTLRYGNNFGGEWHTKTVEPSDESGVSTKGDHYGQYTSLLLGDQATIYIGFHNVSKGDAYLAIGTADQDVPKWAFKAIYTEGDVGKWLRLARHGKGLAAAFFDESNGDLIVALQKDENFSFDPMRIDHDANVGTDIGIAATSDGSLHVSYLTISSDKDTFDLRHAVVKNVEFTTRAIEQFGIVGFWSNIELIGDEPTFIYHLAAIVHPDPAKSRHDDILIYPNF